MASNRNLPTIRSSSSMSDVGNQQNRKGRTEIRNGSSTEKQNYKGRETTNGESGPSERSSSKSAIHIEVQHDRFPLPKEDRTGPGKHQYDKYTVRHIRSTSHAPG